MQMSKNVNNDVSKDPPIVGNESTSVRIAVLTDAFTDDSASNQILSECSFSGLIGF